MDTSQISQENSLLFLTQLMILQSCPQTIQCLDNGTRFSSWLSLFHISPFIFPHTQPFLVLFIPSRLRERLDQLIIHALAEAITCHANDVLLLGVILLLPNVREDLQEL